jgi:phage terminase large subunit
MIIRPNKYAGKIFHPDFKAYEIDLWGGRGRGGSYHLTLKAVQLLYTAPYFRGFFVRAIQGSIRLSLWKDFLDRLDELSELNSYDYRSDFEIREDTMSAKHKLTGNEILSKGFKASSKSNTANMKSIAGATDVFIEETEEVGEEEYNKLADSLRTTKTTGVKIWRSWNAPSKDKWIIKQYYDLEPSGVVGFYKAVPKGIPNHISIFGTYKDNIKNLDFNTIARYERYKDVNPKYYYNQIMGLISDGGDNKVYYNWRRISYAEFIKIDGYMVYGLDFGDTAPTSLIAVKYKDGCFFRHQILYEPMRAMQVRYGDKLSQIKSQLSGIGNSDNNNIWTKHKGLLTYVFNLIGLDQNTPIFADPAQNGLIIELRQSGFNCVSAKKDKASNINIINRASNFYTSESTDLEEEYENYYLDVDINKNPIDGKPQGGLNDHALDAQEYACRGIFDALGLTL